MKIQWLGQSSFRLEESTGTAIVTDPYPGLRLTADADAITFSQLGKGHNDLNGINGNPAILNRLGAFEIPGIHISSAVSLNEKSVPSNLVFMFRLDGVDICHLGNIKEKCNVRLTEIIGEVDVLIVPVGEGTLEAEEAKDYVDKLMPDIVLPVYYGSEDDGSLEDFLSLFNEEDIEYSDDNTLEVDRAQFDGEYTKVIVFEKY